MQNSLKRILEKQIPTMRNKIKDLKTQHGDKIIGQVTINQALVANGTFEAKSSASFTSSSIYPIHLSDGTKSH